MTAKRPIQPFILNYYFHRDPILNARALSDDCLLSIGFIISDLMTSVISLSNLEEDSQPHEYSRDREMYNSIVRWALKNTRNKEWFVKYINEVFTEYAFRQGEEHPSREKAAPYIEEFAGLSPVYGTMRDISSARLVIPPTTVPPKYWVDHNNVSAFQVSGNTNVHGRAPKDLVSPSMSNKNWYSNIIRRDYRGISSQYTNRTPPRWVTEGRNNLNA